MRYFTDDGALPRYGRNILLQGIMMYRAAPTCLLLIALSLPAFSQDRAKQGSQDPAPTPAVYAEAPAENATARAKFVQQCVAVAANAGYCGCLYGKLPVVYTKLVDQPWLLFTISMYERKYVGELAENDTEQERFNKYLLARGAVAACANVQG